MDAARGLALSHAVSATGSLPADSGPEDLHGTRRAAGGRCPGDVSAIDRSG